MADDPTITDPFYRALHNRLSPEIDRRMVELATGSAKKVIDGVETVAESYTRQVAYIEALLAALSVCKEIQMEMYGGKPKEGE